MVCIPAGKSAPEFGSLVAWQRFTWTPPTMVLRLMKPSRSISAKWSICSPVNWLTVRTSNWAPAASFCASVPSVALYPRA
jgi:hypothetical protein